MGQDVFKVKNVRMLEQGCCTDTSGVSGNLVIGDSAITAGKHFHVQNCVK